MLAKHDLIVKLGIGTKAINKWIKDGIIPNKSTWNDSDVEEIKRKTIPISLDIDQIRELAKTKTATEIAEIIEGTNAGKVRHFCIVNDIERVIHDFKNVKKVSKKERQLNIFNQMLSRSVKS